MLVSPPSINSVEVWLLELFLFDRKTESPQPMLLIVKVAQFDLNRVPTLTQVHRKIGDFKTTIVSMGSDLFTIDPKRQPIVEGDAEVDPAILFRIDRGASIRRDRHQACH